MARRRTLAIVGAGAVLEAWAPVIKAMQANGYEEVRTANAANFALARFVYIGRQLETYSPAVPESVAHRDEFRAKLARLKEAIATELQTAEAAGNIACRPEFEAVIRETVLNGSDEAAIVTTNWDSVVETASIRVDASLKVYYLHGSARGAGAIYLPTEIAEEPYRTAGEKAELVATRRDLVRAINDANHLILYGISVSPLDAELGQLLASGMHGSGVEEVHIVNPSFGDVGERVLTLLDDESLRVKIFGRDPQQLKLVKLIRSP